MPTRTPVPANRKAKEEERAIRWLLKGKTAAFAAKKVGVHPTTVQRWAIKHGITLVYPYNRHEDRTDLVDKDEIIQLSGRWEDGSYLFTQEEIAEMMDCSVSYVKHVRAAARAEGLLD